jgi:hypothetical protein
MTTVTGPRRRMAGAGLVGLALLAALAAGACTKSSATPRIIYVTPPPGPTGTPVTGSPGVTPAPAASPTITSILIDSTAPDGRWKVTFKKPVIGGVSDTTAAAMNDAITNQINAYIDAFTKSDLPVPAKNASPSTLEGDYSISMNTASIVSLRFSVLTMTSGGAHAVGTPGCISFVASTGKTIALADLFTDPSAAAAKIAASTHANLSTQLGGDLTWDGKASSLDFFARAWVFTPAGLDFYWPQGQLASMAAGMPSAVVPWAELKPLVKASSPAGAFTK